jgi:hypothetical protein
VLAPCFTDRPPIWRSRRRPRLLPTLSEL